MLTVFLVFFDSICTGTMLILMTPDPVLVDAHFTSSGLFFFSISVIIVSFLLIFLNFETMQYCGVTSNTNFVHSSIGTTFCIVFFRNIAKAPIA